MTSNLSNKAKKIMTDQKGHCAQAIFATYGSHIAPDIVDFEAGMNISSAFSGGVAHQGNICGALNGALMVLGLKYGGTPREDKVTKAAIKLFDDFKALHGTIMCRELIKHDLLTDEDVKHAFEVGAFNDCPKFVEDVGKLLEGHL